MLTDSSSFTEIRRFTKDISLQEELLRFFPNTPKMFWSDTCVKHNGFYNYDVSPSPVAASPHASLARRRSGGSSPSSLTVALENRIETHFRLIIKTINMEKSRDRSISYNWFEMAFLSLTTETTNLMVCFDVPEGLAAELKDALSSRPEDVSGPFALHIPLLGRLVKSYDQSVWDIAKTVRQFERVSSSERVRHIFGGGCLNRVS